MSGIKVLEKHEGKVEFRQKRFSDENIDLTVTFSEKSLKVLNWSRTGMSIEKPNESLTDKQIIKNVSVFLNGEEEIFKSDIEVVIDRGDSVGVRFISKLFPLEVLESTSLVKEFEKKVEIVTSSLESLDDRIFKVLTQLSVFLKSIEDECDNFQNKIKHYTFVQKNSSKISFRDRMGLIVTKYLREINREISLLVKVDDMGEKSIFHELFQKLIYPFFESSYLAKRAFEKPLGYAGDFEMMNQIYRNGYEGDDLKGEIFHNYIANEMSSLSVKFRKPYFINKIKETVEANKGRKVKILSLASGPCVEVQELIEKYDQEFLDNIEFTLFDLDRQSLEYAQTRIYELCNKTGKKLNLAFINASVRIFLEHSGISEKYDLLYSGGLFDYFDNKTSSAIVTSLYDILNESGRMIIGNFTHDNPTKAFCHFVTDWNLIHKYEEDIQSWSKYIKGEFDQVIEYDDNKINAFLVLNKNG